MENAKVNIADLKDQRRETARKANAISRLLDLLFQEEASK
jgi:hypothetical protein|tara:strand:- start:27 stop:146 length:120 start_codon:yes stop_codon:yes gene_type:complete